MSRTSVAYSAVLRSRQLMSPDIPKWYELEVKGQCWGWLTHWLTFHRNGYLRVFANDVIRIGSIASPNAAYQKPVLWDRQIPFKGNDVLHPNLEVFMQQ